MPLWLIVIPPVDLDIDSCYLRGLFQHMDALNMGSSSRRHSLTDEQWRLIEPMLPRRDGAGRPPKDHRLVLDGILWVLGTGVPWRDLPECFGPWKTIYERFRRWTRTGVWEEIHAKCLAAKQQSGQIEWRLFLIDATNVRAHTAASGARRKRPAGEPDDHALGISRGGVGTKSHLICDVRGLPIVADLTAGQTHESTRAIPLLGQIAVASGGRPRQRPERLAGDKAYSVTALRNGLVHRKIEDVIPTRKDQLRNPAFDKEAYRERNGVERLIGWLKEKRRLATRYEKLALHYLGMLRVGMILRVLR